MQVETALFFESIEQIYARIFRTLKPRTAIPSIEIRFRKFAGASSRIKLEGGRLAVEISDLLEVAPAPIHEALASILMTKLFGRIPERSALARYRRYLNRGDIRRSVQRAKQERGRKIFRDAQGKTYNLRSLFEELNFEHFHGLMAQPQLGWSIRSSSTTLGHYDPCHHAIVLSSLLDTPRATPLIVRYVLFHEMLHLRFPAEHRGARRCVHTREFKQAERLFPGYEKAVLELRTFVEASRED
jgi:hypothetical protein